MAASRIQLPERKRNYRFALTPLADVMFQLLVFFMLSSSLTPYSLLTVHSAAAQASAQAAALAAALASAPGETSALQARPPGEVAFWTLEADAVVVGGQRFGFAALPSLAEALGRSGGPAKVVLIVGQSARVQDVSTVLARLRLARVSSVQVMAGDS